MRLGPSGRVFAPSWRRDAASGTIDSVEGLDASRFLGTQNVAPFKGRAGVRSGRAW